LAFHLAKLDFKTPYSTTEKTDLELINEYKQRGDLEVLGQLYGRYTHLVYGVSLKYLKDRDESKDAVMSIFEELIEKVKKFEIHNFKSWLHVTTRNYCLMELRSKKRQPEEMPDTFMEIPDISHHEDKRALENDLTRLEECIEQLKDEQKQCVRLFFLNKKCYKEIEAITSFPQKKVKSYIQNGKRNLKTCMEDGE